MKHFLYRSSRFKGNIFPVSFTHHVPGGRQGVCLAFCIKATNTELDQLKNEVQELLTLQAEDETNHHITGTIKYQFRCPTRMLYITLNLAI